MILSKTGFKNGVTALTFDRDISYFTSGFGAYECKIRLMSFNTMNAVVPQIQFYSVLPPSGEVSVFEVLDGVIYNDLAFQTDYENGDVDALQVERGDFAVFGAYYNIAIDKVTFEVDDLLEYAFGRNTEVDKVRNYLIPDNEEE